MITRPSRGQDWSDNERAEIRRLEKVCDASEHWTVECTQTDVGDPWCIVYDQEHHRIILHIARIEGQYVVVWSPCPSLPGTQPAWVFRHSAAAVQASPRKRCRAAGWRGPDNRPGTGRALAGRVAKRARAGQGRAQGTN